MLVNKIIIVRIAHIIFGGYIVVCQPGTTESAASLVQSLTAT